MPVAAESPTASTDSLANVSPKDVVAGAEAIVNPPRKLIPEAAVQHLRKAGLIANDADQTTLTMLKRVDHLLYANEPIGKIPELQRAFRDQLAAVGGDITKLAVGGVSSPIVKFVDDCLAERSAHYKKSYEELNELAQPLMGTYELAQVKAEAKAAYEKYEGERAPYQTMPELITDIVNNFPHLLDKYYRLDELALKSGIVKGDPIQMRDEIDDVGAEIATVRLFHAAPDVMLIPKATLEAQQKFPESFKTNILLAAESTALNNKGLEKVTLFDGGDSTPEVTQILALNTLLSAHVHALTTHNRASNGDPANRTLQELADNVAAIPDLVSKYQKAAASLSHVFLNQGEGANDPRMKALDASLVRLAKEANIKLLDNAEDAQRAAVEAANASSEYLRGRFADNTGILAKIGTLVERATSLATEKNFAAKEGKPPETFAAAAAAAAKGAVPTL